MAKRAVRNPVAPDTTKSKIPDNYDIKIARAWKEFRSRITKYYENVKESVVELQFDSTIDDSTFYTFVPGEAVFLSDIKISPKNQVIFTVPHGTKEKAFRILDGDCITVTDETGSMTLERVLTKNFREAFTEECPDINSINILERKYVQQYPEMRDILNNVDDYIREYEENKNKDKIYATIENYGIF